MWQTGAGGMGSHGKDNPWLKLMGMVHKERRQPCSTLLSALQKNQTGNFGPVLVEICQEAVRTLFLVNN
ncbi:hypothetical protein V9T40_012362 [Parthenolecanium corni]|uniref:Uncharacterized protein n=1 Tax=Parthenolecanium corni TaxID=536013 RepID=A0AAN9XZ14_9HEMI